ncbi:MAG: TolC family protein [Methylomonas sp.]
MSVRHCVMSPWLLGMWFFSVTCHGLDLPDVFDDPLQVKPEILTVGVKLPDQSSVMCTSALDLNQPLTLSDAVDLALCHNHQIQMAWADIKIQAGLLGQYKAAYLPTLTGTVSGLNTGVSYPGLSSANTNTTGHTAYANLTWRLIDFGGRAANFESAINLLDAALASHDATIQNVLSTVIGAYFEALTAEAVYQSRIDMTRLATNTMEATRRREDKGSSNLNDSLQAKTALAKAKLAEQRALGDYRKAVSVLVYQMGLTANTEVLLKAQFEKATSQDRQIFKALQDWLVIAQDQHPAIKSARLQWEASKTKIMASRSEGLPTLDFTSSFYQNGYPNQGMQHTQSDTTTVGVVLSIPLFEGFSRTYKIRQAQAQAEKDQAQLNDIEKQIASEIVKAHADAVSAYENLAFAESLFATATATLESSEHRYNKGAADILELLSVQSALADARQEKLRCFAEWQSSRLRLVASAGLLGRHAF